MSQNPDYFAPTKWEPPPPREPWRPSRGLVITVVALLVLGGAAFAGLKVRDYLKQDVANVKGELVVNRPEANVITGQALKWRTLATFPKPDGFKHPLPELVVDDFTADGQRDIFLLDFSSRDGSRIYQPDGSARKVKGRWDVVSRFYSWDFDRDGVAELIPHAVVYALVPVTPVRLAMTRLCGG